MRTTTSCSMASGRVIITNTIQKWGQTSRTDRRNASRTEQSSRLMSGPTRAHSVPTTSPGMMRKSAPTAVTRNRMASAMISRIQGSVANTSETGCGVRLRSTAPTRRSSMPA